MRASRASRAFTALLSLTALVMLTGADEGGCGEGLDNRAGEPGIDVGGAAGATWDLTYGEQMEITVKSAGAAVVTKNIAVATGGVFDVDGTSINLSELCTRPDVACPQELFPAQVTMTQPGDKLHLLYVTFNKVGPYEDVAQKLLLGNVDSDFDFSIALGITGATNGICGFVGGSYATGHIDGDGADPPSGVSLQGDIVTVYSGGCAVLGSGGAAGAGLTIELRLPFDAVRR